MMQRAEGADEGPWDSRQRAGQRGKEEESEHQELAAARRCVVGSCLDPSELHPPELLRVREGRGVLHAQLQTHMKSTLISEFPEAVGKPQQGMRRPSKDCLLHARCLHCPPSSLPLMKDG